MIKIGLIVNPIAGMGGRVGLKGTDGMAVLAMEMGAVAEAPQKTVAALNQLLHLKDRVTFLTCSGDMGENECIKAGLDYEIVYETGSKTSSADTISAAHIMVEKDIELLIFSGGDGTARDVCKAIGEVVPSIGIPSGVKIHSPVYGSTPVATGKIVAAFIEGKKVELMEEEVVDIDEEAYRKDMVLTKLYGYLKVPVFGGLVQNRKAPTPLTDKASQMAIALDVTDNMKEDVYYIVGPGSTTKAVMDSLGLKKTLLGIDIVKNRKLIGADCSEREILDIIGDSMTALIITPTGGQGYLLGRGNQQISPEVLKRIHKDNIIIIATESKLVQMRGKPFMIYTGDESLDNYFSGYYRIRTGYGMTKMYKVGD
ncbi:MAG: ATP-NAD kinase family protein [Gudongella sp.]|jgi:predicted polyphosphate/ATP-dependent NAD kinase|nr:ATP-NAD kinase family protein [Gudongella sp.]